MKQYASIDDTVYFWFAGNDTSGSGGDGATPAADVRLAGAAADAAPVYSPTPVVLSHAGYPAGAYEIAIAATAGNGFATGNTYAVFCTLAIDSQNPTGFVGSFDLKPVDANTIQYLDSAAEVVPDANITHIHGNAITETVDGYLAAAFVKLFDVATPVLVASDVMRGTDNANTTVPDAAGVTPTVAEIRAEMEGAGYNLALIMADTNELQGDWANAGRLDAILDIIAADTTTDIPALIAALNNVSVAEINAEVVDVIRTDTMAEMAQGAPPASPTLAEAMNYLYRDFRNKSETTASEHAVYNDAGAVKIVKATLADNGTTMTKGEYGTGA